MTNKYDVRKICYTKEDGSVSERDVIIISEPSVNVKALEVTGLPAEKIELIQEELNEHAESLKALEVSWKSFKPNNLKYL